MKVVVRDLDAKTHKEIDATEQTFDLDKTNIRLVDENGLYCSITQVDIPEPYIIIRIFSEANKTRVEAARV